MLIIMVLVMKFGNKPEGKISLGCWCAGTGGTITGISKYLKEKNSKIHVTGADPKVLF